MSTEQSASASTLDGEFPVRGLERTHPPPSRDHLAVGVEDVQALSAMSISLHRRYRIATPALLSSCSYKQRWMARIVKWRRRRGPRWRSPRRERRLRRGTLPCGRQGSRLPAPRAGEFTAPPDRPRSFEDVPRRVGRAQRRQRPASLPSPPTRR